MSLQPQWITALPFLAAPLYLTYYTYKVYLGRVEDERRHTQEMADLHLATIEALALAIDAKDQTSQLHIRRVQLYAAALAQGSGDERERNPGRQDGGAAARHRQARRARAYFVQARAAHARGVSEDPRPSEGRRRHRELCAVPVPRGAADPEPPRALGRQRLSHRFERGRDPARRADPVGRRLLRRADGRASVPQGHDLRVGPWSAPAGSGQGVSIRRSSRCSPICCQRCSRKR